VADALINVISDHNPTANPKIANTINPNDPNRNAKMFT